MNPGGGGEMPEPHPPETMPERLAGNMVIEEDLFC